MLGMPLTLFRLVFMNLGNLGDVTFSIRGFTRKGATVPLLAMLGVDMMR